MFIPIKINKRTMKKVPEKAVEVAKTVERSRTILPKPDTTIQTTSTTVTTNTSPLKNNNTTDNVPKFYKHESLPHRMGHIEENKPRTNVFNDFTNTQKREKPSVYHTPFSINPDHPLNAYNKRHMYVGPDRDKPSVKAVDLEPEDSPADMQTTKSEKIVEAVDLADKTPSAVDLDSTETETHGRFTPAILTSNPAPNDALITEVKCLNPEKKIDGSKGAQYMAFKDTVYINIDEFYSSQLVRNLTDKESEVYREAMNDRPGRYTNNFSDLKKNEDLKNKDE